MKLARLPRIPWKIFVRVVIAQNLAILLSLLLFGLFIRRFLSSHVPELHAELTLHAYDQYLTGFLGLTASLMGLFSVWAGRKLVFPIGRLLTKTRNALSDDASLGEGELGEAGFAGLDDEWSDLESSIEKIRMDLEAKAESLSIEREELSTLMSAISDAILAVDPQGKPLFFNSRFALLFGNEDALRKRDVLLWEMFRAPEILDGFQTALLQGQASSVKAFPYERDLGTRRFFSLSVSPLRKQAGEIYGAVGIFHDVTELKSAEQIRIDFVANVSHELRTPLTSIKGYTDTLLQDMQAGRQASREFLDTIARNVDRLMSLIGDLLDLSSLDSTDVIHTSQINTQEITLRVIRQLNPTAELKKQSIELSFGAASVDGDAKRLEQVLVNLIDNAMKYTPSGGQIRVEWEQGGNEVLLRVKDNGPGIPSEHHGRLFERFYRVDKARSREQGGTGLGLAIVKHIMQKHGGSVSVESRVGGGSTFVCRFPLALS